MSAKLEPTVTLESIGEEEEGENSQAPSGDRPSDGAEDKSDRMKFLELENVTINFLPLNSLPDIANKE